MACENVRVEPQAASLADPRATDRNCAAVASHARTTAGSTASGAVANAAPCQAASSGAQANPAPLQPAGSEGARVNAAQLQAASSGARTSAKELQTAASDTRANAKMAYGYLVASILCALAAAVYEHFSFGVYSSFMLYAFLIPLVGGALPFSTLALRRASVPSVWARRLYGAGLATLTVGSLLQGALEIYGTTNSLVLAYPVVGLALALAGVGAWIGSRRR